MFLCSLIEELCTKEENDKTGCNFNFGHECMSESREFRFKNSLKNPKIAFFLLAAYPALFDVWEGGNSAIPTLFLCIAISKEVAN